MPDSRRLSFFKALTAQLESIVPDSNSPADLTGKVFRGVRTVGQEEDLPYILLSQDPDTFSNHLSTELYDGNFRFFLVGAIEVDPIHPTDTAENFLAQVKEKIASSVSSETDGPNTVKAIPLSNYDIRQLRMGMGVTYTDKDRNDAAMFLLDVSIRITEDATDLF